LFLAREAPISETTRQFVKYPVTLDATEFPLLQGVLVNQSGLVLSDTKLEQRWRNIKGSNHLRSWLCVPLVASRQTLGLLSLGHSEPGALTQEHLRLAKSLAIPAAAAIQNARLYECAKIYCVELEKRTSELSRAHKALAHLDDSRADGEAKL
jgi:GAF domain-containing protein